jgi:PAS domain S-box-containing protein
MVEKSEIIGYNPVFELDMAYFGTEQGQAIVSVLTIAWSMAAAASITLGLLHLVIFLRKRNAVANLLFSIIAMGGAGLTFTELLLLNERDIQQYVSIVKISHLFVSVLLIPLVWLVYVYFKTARRWLALTITGIWAITLVISHFSPYGINFSDITELKQISLPWGQSYTKAICTENPWCYLCHIAVVMILYYVSEASVRLWRRGDRRHAWVIGGSIVVFFAIAGIHSALVDFGLITSPYLISFAFLLIIFVMSYELCKDALLASALTQDIAASESRWYSLLENVRLVVVSINQQGIFDYLNPYACGLLGYDRDEILGRPFNSIFAGQHKAELRSRFNKIANMQLAPREKVEYTIVTKSGQNRILSWSTVQLFDREKRSAGLLSIGIDLTDQKEAERRRDQAIGDLKEVRDRLSEENLYLKKEYELTLDQSDIIGNSEELKYVLMKVEQVALTDATVLVLGPTGVGKELVARAIHQASGRSEKPFIRVNCAAVPDNLIESELFGHEKGAFTSAEVQRKGRFELADGGTLLMDEVGDISPQMQVKLLRVLQEGEFQRVGGTDTLKVNVRVIATTNRDLKKQVDQGDFREDLFYRLNIFPITVPPLSQRKSDIPLLVEHFVQRACTRFGKRIQEVPGSVMCDLRDYHWPGNIRELENVIERAVIISDNGMLQLAEPLVNSESRTTGLGASEIPLTATLQEAQRRHIMEVLKATGGKVSGQKGAARILGINPSTLRSRIKKLDTSTFSDV